MPFELLLSKCLKLKYHFGGRYIPWNYVRVDINVARNYASTTGISGRILYHYLLAWMDLVSDSLICNGSCFKLSVLSRLYCTVF